MLPELLKSSEADERKDGKQLEQIMLTTDEWNFLEELIYVLGPFEEATRLLGGEKYITHSIMHPILKEIKRLLLLPSPTSSTSSTSSILPITPSNINSEIEKADDVFVIIEQVELSELNEIIVNRNNENQRIQNNNNQKSQEKINLNQPFNTKNVLDKVKENLYNAMCFYWRVLPEDYLLSTILDPRVKHIYDKDEEEEILRKKYKEYKEIYLPTPLESRASSPTPPETSTIIYQPRLLMIFEQNQVQSSDEVAEYLKEDKINFTQSPFEWWMNKKGKYPILARLARIYLAVPATSTPSERLFSDAGNLLTSKRARINSELFKHMGGLTAKGGVRQIT